MLSGASGRKRSLLPLPRTRSCASSSNTSSRFKAITSAERSPCRSIKPTMAKSREVRKLDQKRATSFTESGTMLCLGTLTRSRWFARLCESGFVRHGSADRSRGSSRLSRLQQRLKLPRITALDEEVVGIVARRQEDAASSNTSRPETICKLLRGLLTAAIGVNIEGEINRAFVVAQLPKLAGVEVGAQRAGEVMKTCLPQHGIVEQPLDENYAL